ncbi:D-alanyl-lipoteichoic acid biosynthesis protein DltD [Streptococcus suis]|nr:D-alanyl-lipoteichoic acid biosynthesis protein DltD [Streptococcus suis]
MLKRLWLILGPVLVAAVLAFMTIMLYPLSSSKEVSYQTEKEYSVALSANSFKQSTIKKAALTDSKHRFIPFFGSSEWSRFDTMNPAILAQGYDRGYRPYMLGERGSASLTHYLGMQQMEAGISGKKAVYVVSPQWFTREGTSPAAFAKFFSTSQLTDFLLNQKGTKADRVAAKRLLRMQKNGVMSELVTKVAQGRKLTASEKSAIERRHQFALKQEALFGHVFPTAYRYNHVVVPRAKALPQPFSYEALERLATAEGKAATSNNDLQIQNSFFKQRIKGRLPKLKGFQRSYSYLQSPEYTDLELVLHEFAKNQTRVMFVIPPVNERWAAYSGLNLEKYQQAVAKIKYQLESQGFHHILDLSKDGSKDYFMQDTIHLGWNGWLAFDKGVNAFLTSEQPAPDYHLQDIFLSKKWANTTKVPYEF